MQLFVDAADVRVHGVRGDAELFADLLVQVAFGQQVQHLPLPGCQILNLGIDQLR